MFCSMGDNKGEDTCENDAVLPWNFTVPKMCDNNKYNKHETDCNEGTPEFICYKSGQDDEKLLILEDYLNEVI